MCFWSTDAGGSVGKGVSGAISGVDLTRPRVLNATSPNNNGTYKTGARIEIVLAFSENVNVNATNGTPYLILNAGAGSKAYYFNGSGSKYLSFMYNVSDGDSASDLNYASNTSLKLNGGSIKDSGSNSIILTLPEPSSRESLAGSKNIAIDTSKPRSGPSYRRGGGGGGGGGPVTAYSGQNITIKRIGVSLNRLGPPVLVFDLQDNKIVEGDGAIEIIGAAVSNPSGQFKAEINFSLNRAWLSRNNASPEDVMLLRLSETSGRWIQFETSVSRNAALDPAVEFSAAAYSPSRFYIAGSRQKTEDEEEHVRQDEKAGKPEQPAEPHEEPAAEIITEPVGAGLRTQKNEQKNNVLGALTIAAIISVILVVFMVVMEVMPRLKKRKNRKTPPGDSARPGGRKPEVQKQKKRKGS